MQRRMVVWCSRMEVQSKPMSSCIAPGIETFKGPWIHFLSYKCKPSCATVPEADYVILPFLCCLATCMTSHSLEMIALSLWMTTVSILYTSMFSHQKWLLNCPSLDYHGRSSLLQIATPQFWCTCKLQLALLCSKIWNLPTSVPHRLFLFLCLKYKVSGSREFYQDG